MMEQKDEAEDARLGAGTITRRGIDEENPESVPETPHLPSAGEEERVRDKEELAREPELEFNVVQESAVPLVDERPYEDFKEDEDKGRVQALQEQLTS